MKSCNCGKLGIAPHARFCPSCGQRLGILNTVVGLFYVVQRESPDDILADAIKRGAESLKKAIATLTQVRVHEARLRREGKTKEADEMKTAGDEFKIKVQEGLANHDYLRLQKRQRDEERNRMKVLLALSQGA
jgi:hypothetical protein